VKIDAGAGCVKVSYDVAVSDVGLCYYSGAVWDEPDRLSGAEAEIGCVERAGGGQGAKSGTFNS